MLAKRQQMNGRELGSSIMNECAVVVKSRSPIKLTFEVCSNRRVSVFNVPSRVGRLKVGSPR